MTPTYSLLSTEVSPPLGTYAPASLTTGSPTPPGISAFADGSVAYADGLNALWRALAALSVGAGNGPGILEGIEVDIALGLSLSVSAGTAIFDRVVQKAATNYVVPDATAAVYVWLLPTGAVTHTTSLTVPNGGSALYLCRLTTVAGAVTNIDYSGRVTIRDGVRSRRVADVGKPADSPSSTVRVFTRTARGEFFWNGSSHDQMLGATLYVDSIQGDTGAVSAGFLSKSVASGDVTLTAAEMAALGIGTLEVTGAPVAARTVTIPQKQGLLVTVVNTTGQSVQIRLAGAGTDAATVPANTAAPIYQNATGIRPASASATASTAV